MLKKSLFTILALVLATSFVTSTHAEDVKLGLSVSPSLKEANVKPGEKFSDIIKITNTSSTDVNVEVTLQDFRAKNEEGDKLFLGEENNDNPYALVKWIKIEKTFSLKQNETKEIDYTINVPADAEPGGHYAVILFQPKLKNQGAVASSGTVIEPIIGTTLLVTVEGDIKYGAKIVEFSTGKNLYTGTTNVVNFVTRFQNLSSVHVKPVGTIEITNFMGKVVYKMNVNENQTNVLSDSIRRYENSWTSAYGFGPYKAKLTLNYGEGKTISSMLSFWIIPWRETLIGLIVLILVIWLLSHLAWKK